jgi:hypothetical protein
MSKKTNYLMFVDDIDYTEMNICCDIFNVCKD